MLDFHRAAPTSPWTNTFGYLVGSTALGHVLAGACLPFFLVAGLLGEMSIFGLLTVQAALWLSALLYHTVALLVAVLVRPGKAASGGAIVVVLALLIGAFPLSEGGLRLLAFLTPYPAIGSGLGATVSSADIAAIGADLTLFGLPVHPLLATLIVQGSALGLSFWAVARRLGSDDTPVLPRLGGRRGPGLDLRAARGRELDGSGPGRLSLGASPAPHSGCDRYRRRRLPRPADPRPPALPARAPARPQGRAAPHPAAARQRRELGGLGAPGRRLRRWLRARRPRLSRRVSFGHAFGPDAIATLVAALALLALFASIVRYAWFVHRRAPAAFAVLILFLSLILPWILWAVLTQASLRDGSVYLLALDPVFALGEAADALLDGWGARQVGSLLWGPYLLSLGVTLGLTAMLGWRTNGVVAAREALTGARSEEEG